MSLKNQCNNENQVDVRDLKSLLQGKYGEKLQILNYSVNDLVGFGENFAGNLLKVNVTMRRTEDSPIEELYFVVKTIEDMNQTIDWTFLMKREAFMYTNIVPFYETIELENGIDKNSTIANNFAEICGYRLSLDSEKDKADNDAVLLLKNLKIDGYYVLEKKGGLDLQHATKAIKTLAKFHAFGIATKRKYPAQFAEFKTMMQPHDFSNMLDIFDNFLTWTRKHPHLDKYKTIFEDFTSRRKLEGWNMEAVQHDDWSTIIHYDFWTNNIMFQRNEATGEVKNVKIIDFQSYFYGDVCLDLYYFLSTSLDDNIKFQCFDELLELYYDTFISVLKSLGVDVSGYSKEKFEEVMKKDAWFEFVRCALALSFFTYDPDPSESRNELFDKLISFHGNELFQKKFADLLRIYEMKGWLD